MLSFAFFVKIENLTSVYSSFFCVHISWFILFNFSSPKLWAAKSQSRARLVNTSVVKPNPRLLFGTFLGRNGWEKASCVLHMFVISSHFFLIVDNPGGSQRTHLLSGLLSPGYASHNFLVLRFFVEYTTSVMIFAMKWLFNTLINLQRNLLYRAFTVVTQKQKELSDSRYPFLCQYTGLWMSCKNLHNLIRILCLV